MNIFTYKINVGAFDVTAQIAADDNAVTMLKLYDSSETATSRFIDITENPSRFSKIAVKSSRLTDITATPSRLTDITATPSRLTDITAKQLEEYLTGKRREFDVPLDPRGTDFQRTVWDKLTSIPYGETISYKQVAELIDKPKACRAVGMANNKNPIWIIIPCHRVIGSDGSPVGYGGGLELKRKLLYLENPDFIMRN